MKTYVFLSLFTFCLTSVFSQTTLVNLGANWDYYDNQNEPEVQGAIDWNDPGYDIIGWGNGNAELGYGDGDETTPINPNTLTGYFRHTFNISNPGNFSDLSINLTYDDGAVVYLNGNEVWRVNMPTGTISYGTFSSTQSNDNAQASNTISNALISGTNVISVEVHQRSTASSDISFDLKLTGNQVGSVSVSRGPYLQKLSSNSITVKWRTVSLTESVVNYGTSLGNLNQTVSDLTPKTEHEIQLTGLNSDTNYFYEIANASVIIVPQTSSLYFRTAPVPGTQKAYKFWVLGDPGTANNNQRAVRDAYYNFANGTHTDGILFLGDNAYNSGTDSEYQFAMFENMYEEQLKNTVAWSCLGNHDGYSANSNDQTGPYYDIFSFPTNAEAGGLASGTEAYYSFDYGNIHFISLDSYETDRSVSGSMFNWALADIQNTTQEWIVAFWHHPPYTKGSHNSDTESNLIDMRQNFLPMLESNGVDLVLSGHSHSYERSYFLNGHYGNSDSFNSSTHTVGTNGSGDGRIGSNGAYSKETSGANANDGAVYITAGSSGKISGGTLDHEAMFYSVSQLGSCVLEVTGNQLDVGFLRENGNVDDYFTIIKQPSCVIGTSCDDNDPCTINDVYDNSCNCAGTTAPDSDNDGVCDALDQCNGTDDALIGTSCDDNDPCTINDIYDNSCNCAGTSTPDSDNDGVCAALDPDDNDGCNPDSNSPACDPCTVIISDGFESGFGNWIDGGNDCALSTSNAYTGAYSVRLRDNSSTSILTSNSLDFSLASEAKVSFTYYPVSMENGEDFFLEVSTNGGSSYTVIESWARGVEFENNNRYFIDLDITGISLTSNTVFRLRCDASGNNDNVYIDDLAISACDVNCTQGSPCDDNDICTINDVFDANCNCEGIFQDIDGDGVCDSEDLCPGTDDAIIGQSCNDNDPCTTNDVYDNSCNCAGTYTDSDGDGLCVSDDPDDNDACNPDPNNPACSSCDPISSDGFESGFGNWNDPGSDCARVTTNPNTGNYSIRIRDNSSTSQLISDPFNLSGYSEINVLFSYYPASMENGEDFFLEVSTNGGSSYSTIQSWVSGVDFVNNVRENELVYISGITFTNNTVIRFRCDASNNNDQIYLDGIVIEGCNNSSSRLIQDKVEHRSLPIIDDVSLYPNPAQDLLIVDFGEINTNGIEVGLFNINGQLMYQSPKMTKSTNMLEIELGNYSSGLYYLQIRNDKKIIKLERVIISK